MATSTRLRSLAQAQYWVVTTEQLEDHRTSMAIRHAVDTGHLHRIHRGVYAVGRPDLTREGWWMAGVLGCGPGAALSWRAGAALWAVLEHGGDVAEVSIPTDAHVVGPARVLVHRSKLPHTDVTV